MLKIFVYNSFRGPRAHPAAVIVRLRLSSGSLARGAKSLNTQQTVRRTLNDRLSFRGSTTDGFSKVTQRYESANHGTAKATRSLLNRSDIHLLPYILRRCNRSDIPIMDERVLEGKKNIFFGDNIRSVFLHYLSCFIYSLR